MNTLCQESAPVVKAPIKLGALGTSRSFLQRLSAYLAGALFTYLLFTGIGRLQQQEHEEPPPDLETLSDIATPPPPPPPPRQVEVQPQQQDTTPMELIGFELSRSESPVKIAAVPVLLSDNPNAIIPPTAYMQGSVGTLAVKPNINVEELDTQRIYSGRDVDQRAVPVYKKKPRIYGSEFSRMQSTKINVMFVVDTKGHVADLRVLRSTGNTELDQRMVDAIRKWEFTPAIRRGKPVRQWFEQLINIDFGTGNPFDTQ